ncbi:MAG: sigma factor [Methylocystis sp.]
MLKSHKTIDRLFRSHHRDLITRARRVIGSDDAEDMVQEAYLKMLESDRGELVANARGYVSKMTCTLAIDALRRQRPMPGRSTKTAHGSSRPPETRRSRRCWMHSCWRRTFRPP